MKSCKTENSDKFPSEWSDDQVMDVYFSPFRERSVNPHSWEGKMKFWADMLRRHCVTEKVLAISGRKLPELFERNGKLPACMDVVIDELLRNGVLKKLSDFTCNVESTWLSWSINVFVKKPIQWSFNNFIKRPLSWAYSKVLSDTETYRPRSRDQLLQTLPDEQYVIVDLVKKSADAVYERHCSTVTCNLTDNLIGYSDMFQRCRDICSDETSFNVTLLELTQQKRCTIVTSNDGERLIRMVSDSNQTTHPVSDIDLKIYRLKVTESKLELSIVKTNMEMEECRINAKACLQQGKKAVAMKCLKRKKMLEASLAQKEQAVDKLNGMINMLQQTESQKQILDAYSTGVKAFKEITQRYGLTEDMIDNTMLNIQEVFAENEQLNETMSQRVDLNEVDDDDLESELNDLLATASRLPASEFRTPQKTTDRFTDFDLPDVPLHTPTPVKATSTPQARQQPISN